MDPIEQNDMNIENPEPEGGGDINIDKVITSTSAKNENRSPESGESPLISDGKVLTKGKMKKEKKIKKSIRRLNQEYDRLKENLSRWVEKERLANEVTAKTEALSKDLKGLIDRSIDLKVPGKNTKLLKKVRKRINRDLKDNDMPEKIKNKILKVEKKISHIENKLA